MEGASEKSSAESNNGPADGSALGGVDFPFFLLFDGIALGALLGCEERSLVGEKVGDLDGICVGDADTVLDGEMVGSNEGDEVGDLECIMVGDTDAVLDGDGVGESVGSKEGDEVGDEVGIAVGSLLSVGDELD
mmetsp:Transcript_14831/g.20662  ORF Transcript_14831/g.20662 Transcript_14831/m.20662 type:complete len:134 (+) Transcript_14831:2362-2763(+)